MLERSKSIELGASHSGTHTAAKFFIDHLEDSAVVIGYRYAREGKIEQILESGGVKGHTLLLRAPTGGFSDFQKERFESYGKSLSVWKRMLVEFDWSAKEVAIQFRDAEEDIPDEVAAKDWREVFRGKTVRAAHSASKSLVGLGFMVREPTSAHLVTLRSDFSGTALVFKYPVSRSNDAAGVTSAYDKWVPMFADAIARGMRVKAETMAEGDMTTLFFTSNKRFLPALYEVSPSFRMIVPRRAKAKSVLFPSSTYRACRALAKQYKKYFDIQRRPLPAWRVVGHSVILEYKKGAGGKLIDDSYIRNVSLHGEKLMKKYGLQCFIQHEQQAKALIVTFYSSADPWSGIRPGKT